MTYRRYRRIERTILFALGIPTILLLYFASSDAYKVMGTVFFSFVLLSVVTDSVARRQLSRDD